MLYRFADYLLDTNRRELRRSGTVVCLQRQEFLLLNYLLARHQRVVSKEELLDELWPGKIVGVAALNTCIKSVRRAVGDSGRTQRMIKTYHRQGYRWVAELHEIETPRVRGPASASMPLPRVKHNLN